MLCLMTLINLNLVYRIPYQYPRAANSDIFDKGPQMLLWASSLAEHVKTTMSYACKRLNYFLSFCATYNLQMWPQSA